MSEQRNPSRYDLRIHGLSKAFPSNGNGPLHALRELSLEITAGEFVVLVGPNGSGKTTFLNLLAGDFYPDDGSIQLINGRETCDWTRLPKWKRAGQLARVHQDPRLGTVAGMTLWENLRLVTNRAFLPSPLKFRASLHKREWFVDRLEKLGLAEKIDSRIGELSQGQRQLLAIELAMLREPDILLLDEHTASLDSSNAQKCLQATVRLSRESLTTVIMVTHNLMDALTYGERLIVFREGRLSQDLGREEKAKLNLDDLLEHCGYVM